MCRGTQFLLILGGSAQFLLILRGGTSAKIPKVSTPPPSVMISEWSLIICHLVLLLCAAHLHHVTVAFWNIVQQPPFTSSWCGLPETH